MTPEDTARLVVSVYIDDDYLATREALIADVAQAIHKAKLEAYEESAQKADWYGKGQVPPTGASCTDAAYIAMTIRLLKDQLVEVNEVVSS